MKQKCLIILLIATIVASCALTSPQPDTTFAHVKNGRFIIGEDSNYHFIGANMWYGAMLASIGEGGNRKRLIQELDELQNMGVNNLRILVGSDGECGINSKVEPTLQLAPGIYNDTILDGLDFLLAEMNKRNMYAVLYLNNSWEWSGGYSQYLEWAGYGKAPVPNIDGWPAYMQYVEQFMQSDSAKKLFNNYVTDIVSRTNRYTHTPYSEDPAIFAWQIGNEPRAFSEANKELFAQWIGNVATLIKSTDANHMVSTGSEGKWGCEMDIQLWERIHSYPEIDYTTIHIWPYNWGWLNTDNMNESLPTTIQNTIAYMDEHAVIAKRLDKPLVLEEFGFPRDSMRTTPQSTANGRNNYYQAIFRLIEQSTCKNGILAGCNFWAWSGLGNPNHTIWQRGDDYTGDPAQEPQGLNSVFACDTATLNIIKKSNQKIIQP